MKKHIAVIDDEPDILELVSLHLQKAGYEPHTYADADSFYQDLTHYVPSLIILDLMLPDTDGFEICKYLKRAEKYSAIPVLMLSAKNQEIDKILGLELGADDYVTKPFSPKELVARVKAILRRNNPSVGTLGQDVIIIGEHLALDPNKCEVYVDNQKISLTSTEFKILQALSANIGWVLSREKLLDYLWGNEKAVLDRTIDVHIKNLRDKLDTAGRYIKNIRGIGYKISLE